jgi:hypothetical protein
LTKEEARPQVQRKLKGKAGLFSDIGAGKPLPLYRIPAPVPSEMVLKYRTENFCNFQSNETRNEYEEEIPKVRCDLQS